MTIPPHHVHRSIRKDPRLIPSADALRDKILYGKAKDIFVLDRVRFPIHIASRNEHEVHLVCKSPALTWDFVIPLESWRNAPASPSVPVVVSCLSVLSQL